MDNTIINKIKKLLARGDESRNDNAAEREIAMRQAHKLLAMHGLRLADVETQADAEQELGELGSVSGNLRAGAWRAGVYNAIAKLNGCVVYTSRGTRPRSKRVNIIGRAMHVTATQQIGAYVEASIDAESRQYGSDARSFCTGAWYGVAEQVAKILKAQAAGKIDDVQLSQSQALVVVNQHNKLIDEAREAAQRISGGLRNTRTRVTRGAQFSNGVRYGRTVGLNQRLGGAGQRALPAY